MGGNAACPVANVRAKTSSGLLRLPLPDPAHAVPKLINFEGNKKQKISPVTNALLVT